LNGTRIASRAGVDVLAHGVGDAPVDDELIALLKKSDTGYVSTLATYEPPTSRSLAPRLLTVLPLAVAISLNAPRSDTVRPFEIKSNQVYGERAWSRLIDLPFQIGCQRHNSSVS
jgi:hypothetical protein